MRRYIFFSIFFSITAFNSIFSQNSLPDYGDYSAEEISMTETALNKDAEAVVLIDEGNSYYDDNYQLITERRIRIKILTQLGVDRGTVSILFYSKEGYETIRKVDGMTYNAGDAKPASKISNKSVYTERVDDKYSRIKFALPNVKPGSIIEYKYISVMKNYGGLEDWYFQTDIPTLKSCYKLEVLPNCDFSYVVYKKSYYNVRIVPPRDNGIIYFEMNDIPGLKSEPYMDAVRDYLQKVEFKFSGCMNQFGIMKEVNDTWKSVANELATSEYLGTTYKTNLPVPMDLSASVVTAPNDLAKVVAIYNYVKNNFGWNGYHGKYAPDGLKKVWEAKTGSAGELNLLLVNLLHSFKFDAKPLLVAEREFGKIDPKHVYVDRFNKTLAYVNVAGRNLILDATNKYCPATLIPYSVLNTYALLIDKKTDALLAIESTDEKYKNTVVVTAAIGKDGLFKGSGVMTSAGYARESRVADIAANKKKFISDKFEVPHQGLKIDSFDYDVPADESAPLVQRFNFNNQLDESGGFVFLNYNLFTGLTKNPFTSDNRFTNINFGYPVDIEISQTIELPPGSKTEDLLKDKTMENGTHIFLSRQIKRTGNTLTIKIVFKQAITLVAADGYNILKSFYKDMIDMLSEPVVIKLGQ